MDPSLSTLISRTSDLHAAVKQHVAQLQIPGHARTILSFKAGGLSLQLASGALLLVQNRQVAPALALMRPQFECLVKGIWLAYTADDAWIEKLSRPLTVENAKQVNNAPMLAQMLRQLKASEDSEIQFTVEQLYAFHEISTAALNSFVHGGMLPLSFATSGYPLVVVQGALRNSNGVVALATQLLSVLTGDRENVGPVERLHNEFADCLPALSKPTHEP